MAGRPVAARGGGGSGVLYGMIVFAIVSVLSLGGMIFSITNLKRAEDDARSRKSQLDQYGTPPAYYVEEARARGTGAKTFSVMASDIEAIAELVAGRKDAVRPVLVNERDRLVSAVSSRHREVSPTGDLFSVVQALDRGLTAAKRRGDELAQRVSELEAERDALTRGLKATQEEFQATVERMGKDLARAEQEKSDAIGAKDEQLRTIEATATAKAEELNAERARAARERTQTEITVGQLTNQVRDLQEQVRVHKAGTFDPDDILTKADGRVLRAIPGSDVVYIDVGTEDGLKPGTRFEVYSDAPDARRAVRGKATIEVVTALSKTAECSVAAATPGQPILEGDLLVNIAFERGRAPRFVVRGSFDLNYDGIIDDSDRERVAALVRAWGGQVVDELDETTDYVVVGVTPSVPPIRPGVRITPVQAVQRERRELERADFRRLVDQARSLSIPVITQSQFLFLTGYTGDYAVRLK